MTRRPSLARTLFWALYLYLVPAWTAGAQDVRTYVPAGAKTYAPLLVEEQRARWPAMPQPWTLAGLVEQESCISLVHSKCWNPRAELKTSREYGFGFGQITVAYQSNGAVRFDKFAELRQSHASLKGWTWENRYDPHYQLRAIVEMNLDLWRRIPPAATTDDHLSFMLSSYNGGVGGLLQDRRLCSNTRGCDQDRWFGNVELTSLKSKLPQPQYGGRSWYDINRGHVRNVMTVRRAKYKPFWGK
ncbi:SAR endolysin transglycosylase [Stenotrophomonas phage Sonora]|nr:SAR endolysin transglycosylase [Stenotrophomonas phage Sonora]